MSQKIEKEIQEIVDKEIKEMISRLENKYPGFVSLTMNDISKGRIYSDSINELTKRLKESIRWWNWVRS